MADDEDDRDTKTVNEADPDAGEAESGGAQDKAQQEEEEVEKAKEVMNELEQGDPPKDLADWPGGKAKYLTYGGADGGDSYDDGATHKLGPSSLRHQEGGGVTIEGEEVDNPEDYKGEPIPGGPSDPDAPPDPAMVGEEEGGMGEMAENSEGQPGGDSGEEAKAGPDSDSDSKASVDKDKQDDHHKESDSGGLASRGGGGG